MKFLPLEELSPKQHKSAMDFLQKHEEQSVQLTATILKGEQNVFVVYTEKIISSAIYGIVSIRKTILHCLPFSNYKEQTALQEDFLESFCDFFTKEKFDFPQCVNGSKNGSELIITALLKLQNKTQNEYNSSQSEGFSPQSNSPVRTKEIIKNEYHLLKYTKIDVKKLRSFQVLPKEFCLVRCKSGIPENYFLQLFNLQAQYEKEEVIPQNMEFSEDSCRLRLKNALRRQYILAIQKKSPSLKQSVEMQLLDADCTSYPQESDSKNNEIVLVSKGGTNAVGIKFVQLGGIFTQKEYRGRHFAKAIVATVLLKIIFLKKSAVLFVKKQNKSAISLYNSIGFTKICDYVIAYF